MEINLSEETIKTVYNSLRDSRLSLKLQLQKKRCKHKEKQEQGRNHQIPDCRSGRCIGCIRRTDGCYLKIEPLHRKVIFRCDIEFSNMDSKEKEKYSDNY